MPLVPSPWVRGMGGARGPGRSAPLLEPQGPAGSLLPLARRTLACEGRVPPSARPSRGRGGLPASRVGAPLRTPPVRGFLTPGLPPRSAVWIRTASVHRRRSPLRGDLGTPQGTDVSGSLACGVLRMPKLNAARRGAGAGAERGAGRLLPAGSRAGARARAGGSGAPSDR